MLLLLNITLSTDKEITPKTITDVKLINAGKILENDQTLAESRVPVGELPGGVITMHVVVRPPQPDKNNGTDFVVPAIYCLFIYMLSDCMHFIFLTYSAFRLVINSKFQMVLSHVL